MCFFIYHKKIFKFRVLVSNLSINNNKNEAYCNKFLYTRTKKMYKFTFYYVYVHTQQKLEKNIKLHEKGRFYFIKPMFMLILTLFSCHHYFHINLESSSLIFQISLFCRNVLQSKSLTYFFIKLHF